jgi:hypothetical protein
MIYATPDDRIKIDTVVKEDIPWDRGDIMIVNRGRVAMLIQLIGSDGRWTLVDLANGSSIITSTEGIVIKWLNEHYKPGTRVSRQTGKITVANGER